MVESTSVVIPAFNEAASIGSLVTNLRAAGHWHEILVIDDGSTDETATRAMNRTGHGEAAILLLSQRDLCKLFRGSDTR